MEIWAEHPIFPKTYFMDDLRFPIGQFAKPETITEEHIDEWISDIGSFPARLRGLTDSLNQNQLNWQYRPNGWSIKQVIHHCADSHMNSFIRFKLALTEDEPTIRPYFEDRWAELPDGRSPDIEQSMRLIEALHAKWVQLLRNLTSEQLTREFIHPEHGQRFSLAENIGIYAWHCNHHLAHVALALNSNPIQ